MNTKNKLVNNKRDLNRRSSSLGLYFATQRLKTIEPPNHLPMFELSKKTFTLIEKDTGINEKEFSDIDHEEIDNRIEKKIGKKLLTRFVDGLNLLGRGSVYISLGRAVGVEAVDAKLNEIVNSSNEVNG